MKNQAAEKKELKETYDRNLLAAQRSFDAAKKKVDEEVEEERTSLDETTKEAEAQVTLAKQTFGNIAAANTGATTTMIPGQSSVEAAAARGVALIPTMPGYILHQNDISPQEMQAKMLANPLLNGMTADQAAAITLISMQLMQEKATYVPPVAAAHVAPPQGEVVEAEKKSEEVASMDETDPLTSDDEENDLRDLNKNDGDVVEKAAKIRRSVKKTSGKGSGNQVRAATAVLHKGSKA